MVKPTIAELSQNNKYNRYTLVMAAAKGARYVIDKENYAKEHAEYEQLKNVASAGGKKVEVSDEKPVKEAINMIYNGEMLIKLPDETKNESASYASDPYGSFSDYDDVSEEPEDKE